MSDSKSRIDLLRFIEDQQAYIYNEFYPLSSIILDVDYNEFYQLSSIILDLCLLTNLK